MYSMMMWLVATHGNLEEDHIALSNTGFKMRAVIGELLKCGPCVPKEIQAESSVHSDLA